jgi:hypothetical protein
MAIKDDLFQTLYDKMLEFQQLITSIAEKLQLIDIGGGGGGGGNATISDYESNHAYTRNTLVVDPDTETVYRVLFDYTSDTVENDCNNGCLKLVGFESQIVTFNGNPTQSQINTLPDDSFVVIYSSADTPYRPDKLE